MFNNLDWLMPGKPWPPDDQDEAARLKEHLLNKAIYNNEHEIFSKYAAYLKDKEDDKKIPIILGWGEKATSNYINLCISEEPDVEYDGQDISLPRPDEEFLIDISRFGLGLYEVTEEGIFAQSPENCYIVTAPGNWRKVTEYVFFHPFKVDTKEYIKVTVHGKGYIQHRVFLVDNGKLSASLDPRTFPAFEGLKIDETGMQKTGIDDILVVRGDNALSTDRRYGRSDYTPSVISLIQALDLAFARREEVLAKFSRPLLQAPESAYNHFDHAKKRWTINLDKPILLEPGSLKAEYLTWQAELGAVEKAIEDKMNQLLYMLDLVKVEEANKAESGTALALKLQPTLSRVTRFAKILKTAIPKVIYLHGLLTNDPKDIENITVEIKNGLPRDQTAIINYVAAAYAGGFMSLETAISTAQNLEMSEDPESPLQKEIGRIKTAQAATQTTIETPQIELPGLEE